MVRIDLLEQRYLEQEIQAVDEGLVLGAGFDDLHGVCLVDIEQVTRFHGHSRGERFIRPFSYDFHSFHFLNSPICLGPYPISIHVTLF